MSYRQKQRKEHIAQGLCVDCNRPVALRSDGTPYTRCAIHVKKHLLSNHSGKPIMTYGRTTGRTRSVVEWRNIYNRGGKKKEVPPAVCPECKVRTCADYWYCPWCGAKLADPDDKEVDTE